MAIFNFNTDAEGWTGYGFDGGGGCVQPIAYWDAFDGYPGQGCMRVDLCDELGGPGEFYNVGSFERLGLSIQVTPGNQQFTFWYKIQNKMAVDRDYRINISFNVTLPTPVFIDVSVPALSTSIWAKYTSAWSITPLVGEIYVSLESINSTPYEGFSTFWLDNVYIDENDPTPPPPVTPAFQPSTGGIPWLIKEDI